VTEAQGVVVAESGTLAGRLARTLGPLFYRPAQPGAQVDMDDTVTFGTLAAVFQLNDESFTLWGACPTQAGAPAACVLDPEGNVLFGSPSLRAHLVDVRAVVSTYGSGDSADVVARLPRSLRR
jgi:hypothetical protein